MAAIIVSIRVTPHWALRLEDARVIRKPMLPPVIVVNLGVPAQSGANRVGMSVVVCQIDCVVGGRGAAAVDGDTPRIESYRCGLRRRGLSSRWTARGTEAERYAGRQVLLASFSRKSGAARSRFSGAEFQAIGVRRHCRVGRNLGPRKIRARPETRKRELVRQTASVTQQAIGLHNLQRIGNRRAYKYEENRDDHADFH